jgi:hypothetical protein
MPATNKVRSLLWVVLGLYFVALVVPAFGEGAVGAQAFYLGLVGGLLMILGGQHIPADPGFGLILWLTWLANPVLWVGCWLLARRSWQGAAWAGVLAVLFGSAIGVLSLVSKAENQPVPGDGAASMTVVNRAGSKTVIESTPRGVSNSRSRYLAGQLGPARRLLPVVAQHGRAWHSRVGWDIDIRARTSVTYQLAGVDLIFQPNVNGPKWLTLPRPRLLDFSLAF